MALVRFSISLDEKLLGGFDRKLKRERCPTRSKGVADLIRQSLVAAEWLQGGEVAGAIVLVYDHHKPNLMRQLIQIQHDHQKVILATQHVHLDHDNCLEILAVRGHPVEIDAASRQLKAIKGLKHVSFAAATTGKGLA